ncbi:hypothetical protein BDY19DRAFT_960482 [Irpex rosettiformis]|uniref:Uncharacterized protein n=1 Tax=Irpex rosettiformis TaxID=378272 RepID=A0ACB8TWZ6_9APHY|nr:hypothetical protein BDY19DRAFT_960482 [Irpex rosettiformis]
MVYIAGLNIHDILARSPLSHQTGVEGIVWWTTVAGVVRTVRRHANGQFHHPHTRRALPTEAGKTGIPEPPNAEKNIGHKPPVPLLVKILSPVAHGFIILAPLAYIIGTGIDRLNQPEWFSNWALPDGEDYFGFGGFAAVRTISSVVNLAVYSLWKRAANEARRVALNPDPTFPQEGPYSIIRHPVSAATLLSQVTYALMWWNTIPLMGLGVTAAYLAASLPYEEKLKEADILTGAEYARYKQRVPYKVIPYVW